MDDKITVPPSVRYKFEERAQFICERAKIDYGEHSQIFSEMTGRMEDLWRRHINNNLTTDDAEAKALDDFGSVKDVARVYRGGLKGLLHRLFYYQRYSIIRLISPVVFCLFHSWLRTSGSLELKIIASHDLQWRMVLFGWDYYIGVIILITIVVTRMMVRTFKIPKLIGQIVAMGVALALFTQIIFEWSQSVMHVFQDWEIGPRLENVPGWENTAFGVFLLGCYMLEAFAFFVVLALATAEILDFHLKRTKRIQVKA